MIELIAIGLAVTALFMVMVAGLFFNHTIRSLISLFEAIQARVADLEASVAGRIDLLESALETIDRLRARKEEHAVAKPRTGAEFRRMLAEAEAGLLK